MIEDIQLRVLPEIEADSDKLKKVISKNLRYKNKINDYRIIKKSIDARKIPVISNLTLRIATGEDTRVPIIEKPVDFKHVSNDAPKLIIIGAGPAGLFAALQALHHGIRPIIIERGTDVDSRRIDIADINRNKRINPDSNYCYGEGGAGAYSDGKLFTRSKKRGNIEEVLQLLVQHGASSDILIDAHPHIGSDRLPGIIKNIRKTILEYGGEVMFNTKMTGLIIKNNLVIGVRTDKGPIYGEGVILAIGHSAHDTLRALYEHQLPMESKGIAMGVRLEHPQHLIDSIQYHQPEGRGRWLPPAEYRMVTQVDGRGVYSFCMCPGGVIVPAGTGPDELVVNGMSASARAGKYANSGMVVEIRPEDIDTQKYHGPLGMMEMQEDLEKSFYANGHDNIMAPAQRMTDFVNGKLSDNLPSVSYPPGVYTADFNNLLPQFISYRLAEGFKEFGRKAKGFLTPDGIMIGLESRTSSPVRIIRDEEKLNSPLLNNLYPAGEGAGYAGGIVSAAVDGMRCVDAFAGNFIKNNNV